MSKQNEISLMEAMALPRKERRRIAKLNGGKKIAGSMRPVVRLEEEVRLRGNAALQSKVDAATTSEGLNTN